MSKDEIFEMAIRELTENALNIRRDTLTDEEAQIYSDIENLSVETEKILSELPEDKHSTVTDYIDKKELAADHECAFLYAQGAKDIVALLKKLSVF